MSPKKETKKSTKSGAANSKKYAGLSAEEIAAMKETLKERKAAASQEEAEKAVLEKIAEMPEPDRSLAKRLHTLIMNTAPTLLPKTWYGMPAYTKADGKLICFFQAASKFKVRYATLGFQPDAHLDEDEMWPTSFALQKLTPVEEKKIAALVKKAIG